MTPPPAIGVPDALVPLGWIDSVGFVRSDGRLHVSFPKVYDSWHRRLIADPVLRTRHLVLLVRVLARYVRAGRPQSAASGGAILQYNPGILDWLEAACELYDEFQAHGLYWTKKTKLSSRSATGPIAWGPTLSTKEPYLIDGVPIHLEVVRRTRARSSEELLHRIHAYVVNEVAELLTGRADVVGSSRMNESELRTIRAAPKAAFMSLARTTYSDRGKKLIKLIQRYLQLSGAVDTRSANGALLFSAKAFELVWEHMLRVTIQNTGNSPVVDLPTGDWTDHDGSPRKGIRPRPDFNFVALTDAGARVAIFDAKDKPIVPKGRSGTEQDHYKQIIYRLLGTYQGPVWNALMFPSLDRGTPESPFEALGSHVWADHPATLVHEIAADYPAVCTAFLAHRRLDPGEILGAMTAS